MVACICNPCTHTERPEAEAGASQMPVCLDLISWPMLQKTKRLCLTQNGQGEQTHSWFWLLLMYQIMCTPVLAGTHTCHTPTLIIHNTQGFVKGATIGRERERRKNHVTPLLFCRGTLRLCYLKTRKLPAEEAFNTTL